MYWALMIVKSIINPFLNYTSIQEWAQSVLDGWERHTRDVFLIHLGKWALELQARLLWNLMIVLLIINRGIAQSVSDGSETHKWCFLNWLKKGKWALELQIRCSSNLIIFQFRLNYGMTLRCHGGCDAYKCFFLH